MLLEFGLEHSSVDSLMQKDPLFCAVDLVPFVFALRFRQNTYFFNKRLLNLLKLDFSSARNTIPHVVSDVRCDHIGIDFEKVEV